MVTREKEIHGVSIQQKEIHGVSRDSNQFLMELILCLSSMLFFQNTFCQLDFSDARHV